MPHQTRPVRAERFNTGQSVPQSGIYRVIHAGHRLPHEVTLLAGEIFPRCSKCNNAVQFEVVRRAPHIQTEFGFKIVIYELPVFEEDEAVSAGTFPDPEQVTKNTL
jgi:hypothetical protein